MFKCCPCFLFSVSTFQGYQGYISYSKHQGILPNFVRKSGNYQGIFFLALGWEPCIGVHGQKWMWLVRSQDSKIDYASKTVQIENTDFLHAGTNSEKLKFNSMIFGWAWSKIAKVF